MSAEQICADITPPNAVAAPEKPPTAEIKNGKVIFRQKPISYEKNSETLTQTVSFREFLAQHAREGNGALNCIPDAHRPVIVKLAHESDKSLSTLVKNITNFILPQDEDSDEDIPPASTLSPAAVENAIKACMTRHNYGLDTIATVKPSGALHVWRWEVNTDFIDYLPAKGLDKAEKRREERVQGKKALIATFSELPLSEKEDLYGVPAGGLTLPPCAPVQNVPLPNASADEKLITTTPTKKHGTENDHPNLTTSAQKPIDPTKALKEQQRLEKKSAKAEKERKDEEAKRKARSMMSNFFSKVPLPQATKNKDSAVAPHNSDFEKTFKPFVVRKNVEMAAVNWFTTPTHPPQKNREVIVIDGDDDVEVSLSRKVVGAVHSPPPAKTSSLALVRSTVERLKQGIAPSAPRHRRPGSILGRSIRDIYTELTEAEISGDVAETRSLTRLLEDRTSFPAKVFTFADDVRPGYMGTWSQTSSVIRPRNPFARDILVCDYNYDSDEEWEGEEEGEGEIVGEEDGARGEEADSEEEEDDELDDWLVDDDEEEALDSVSDANGPDPFLIPEPSKKRKAEGHRKDVKKRKVVPLVAFAKGPVLESSINHCSYAPFKAYQLQLFNDTPLPIDPFTFVSSCLDSSQGATEPRIAKVPAQIPPRLEATAMDVDASQPQASKPGAPKHPFPDQHLPYLISKIGEIRAPTLPLLVETIYQDLKIHKVRKVAIEAKIREVAERNRVDKVWIIKPQMAPVM